MLHNIVHTIKGFLNSNRPVVQNKVSALFHLMTNNKMSLFYISLILFYEWLYAKWTSQNITSDFVFPILFAISTGFLLSLLTGLTHPKIQKHLMKVVTFLGMFIYLVQTLYFCIFHMPLYLYSLVGAGDAMEFGDVLTSTLLSNWGVIVLYLLPLLYLFLPKGHWHYHRLRRRSLWISTASFLLTYGLTMVCVLGSGNGPASQRTQYFENSSLELSIHKLGLLTSVSLEAKQLFKDNFLDENSGFHVLRVSAHSLAKEEPPIPFETTSEIETPQTETDVVEAPVVPQWNVMDIDFNQLMAIETDEAIQEMHAYFSSLQPTSTNDYTGMFKGYNLILITAEAFSRYAVSETLTPTLYKMANNGFVFKNFYNPVWGVSTSDGEYVACTGLIPKSGIWSFSRSSENAMPFVMGNQFKYLGYPTYAYHDHYSTYYDRNLSHPNMGYDFKALGSGLELKESWPESDLEMIDVTSPEFISTEPFHTYFMTVSGHLKYTFSGNYIAHKNKDYVTDLPYSDSVKAYLACNLELEFAMKKLIENLDAAGVLDKTVIVISPDHYPYGLSKDEIDEVAGHTVEDNFELYKSQLIIWNPTMEKVVVEEPCSSLDINPTLSNLFGLEFDSRLLMGSDILSDAPPLIIFSNRSWLTERAKYNSITGEVTYFDGTVEDKDYVKSINAIVNDKFMYSAKILEEDYYRILFEEQ